MVSVTNKMKLIKIFFIFIKVLQGQCGCPARHQDPNISTYNICYLSGLVAVTASVIEMELHLTTLAVAATKPGN
jgi:hypothetical protein